MNVIPDLQLATALRNTMYCCRGYNFYQKIRSFSFVMVCKLLDGNTPIFFFCMFNIDLRMHHLSKPLSSAEMSTVVLELNS